MEDVYDYIEAYFTQTLGDEERKVFEARCVNDEVFANDVAFYIASRQAIRQQLLAQKQQQWSAIDGTREKVFSIKPAARTLIRRWQAYVAAACVIPATALYFLLQNPTPFQLANTYMQKNYTYISVRMGREKDSSLPKATDAFNNKDYKTALNLFEILELKNPGDADEKKYAGLSYLFMKEYDKALEKFDALAKMQLAVNPGNFLKAVTLMERDGPGDKGSAKQLLLQVVNENTDGVEQAKEWLKKM